MGDLQTESIKMLPHSIEAEQAVVGGLLIDNEKWDAVSDILLPEDFYLPQHKALFAAIARLASEGQPLDLVTLGEELQRVSELDRAGGIAYLRDLADRTPSAANVRAYAEIVRERSVMRRLITTSGEIADSVYRPEGRNSQELLDEAERKIFSISEGSRKADSGPLGLNQILTKTINKIESLFQNKNAITGVSTGFKDLDGMTSGLQPSDLVIVAGRPSMGKTSFAMNLVENVAINNHPVLVFSMEMPADSIMMRMLSSIGGIEQQRVRSGQLQDDDWPRLTSAVSLLKGKNLFIDDTPALSPTELRSRTRRVARDLKRPLGLIMVDYLQLMRVPGNSEGRTSEISEISRSLKALAKEMNCPVVALSQLNRSLEQRPNKRPVNSDLRESGAIEQDADIIMFIYRDEVYNPDSPDKGVAEIIIGKQRNGPIGTVRLAFLGKYTRFCDLAHSDVGGEF